MLTAPAHSRPRSSTLTRARLAGTLAVCAVLLLAVLALAPGVGSQSGVWGFGRAWEALLTGWRQGEFREDQSELALIYQIVYSLRLPRTLLAVQAGVTLALCGAVFQVLFRNALATPYTLGVARGGSLGALAAIKFGLGATLLSFGGLILSGITLAAFAGSMAVLGVLYLFTRGARRLTSNELLLAGVTIGLFCNAMMLMLTYLSSARQTFEVMRWMMGSLDSVGHLRWTSCLPFTLPAWIVLIAAARALNQLTLGEEMAAARGVNVPRLQAVCVLFATLAVAAIVAVCGPIGFVGLVVPHVTALLVGRDCRILLPAAALLGGVFLAVCDWISQLAMVWASRLAGGPLDATVLPIGVVTAAIGVPAFLTLLHRRKTKVSG